MMNAEYGMRNSRRKNGVPGTASPSGDDIPHSSFRIPYSSELARFALLKHATPDGLHWDLLLETAPGTDPDEPALLAFSFSGDRPPAGAGETATRLRDHRRRYLFFEGELDGGRGRVRRFDAGVRRLVAGTDASRALELDLHGRQLAGRFRLAPAADDPAQARWRLERLP